MKFLIPLLCLVLVACSGAGEPDPVQETEPPTNVDPGTDEPGTDDPGTDDPGTDDPGTDEPVTDDPVEEPEPLEIELPEVDEAALPVLPGCLQGDNPEGCAGLPEAPTFSDWNCPAGWDSVSAGPEAGFDFCQPPEAGLIEMNCPEGEWSTAQMNAEFILPGNSSVIYVNDNPEWNWELYGTPDNPGYYFQTAIPSLPVAMEFARYNIENGANISALIVASGNYEPVHNDIGIRIIGACPEDTKILVSSADDYAAKFSGPGGGSLENFTLTGSTKSVLVEDTQATLKGVVLTRQSLETESLDDTDTTLTVEDSVIQAIVGDTAVSITDHAELTMRRSVIRDIQTSEQEIDGQTYSVGGIAMQVARQASAVLEDVQISDAYIGMVLGNADDPTWRATLEANRLVLDDLMMGILVGSYVTMDAADVVSRNIGVAALDAMNANVTASRWFSQVPEDSYTSLYFSDSSVMLSDVDTTGGMLGMGFSGSSSVEMNRVAVHGNTGTGLDFIGPELSATLNDVLIENTELFPLVMKHAEVEANRIRIQNSQTLGVSAYASTVDIEDLSIHGLESLGDHNYATLRLYYEDILVDDLVDRQGFFGQGFVALGGSEVTLTRASITDVREVGLWARGIHTKVNIADLHIADVAESLQEVGVGLWADEGANISVDRGLIERCATDGIYSRDSHTLIELSEVVVRDLAEDVLDIPELDTEELEEVAIPVEGKGRGIAVDAGASLVSERVVVERVKTAGVWIVGEGASGVLADTTISEVSHGSFPRTGSGVVVATGAQMSMDRAHISMSTVAGVWVQGVISEVEEVEALEFTENAEVSEVQAVTSAVLSNMSVERTARGHFTGKRGNGIHVTHGGSAEVSRANISKNDGNGIVAIMEGSQVEISESIVIGEIEEVESVESVESVEEVEEVESGDDEVGNGIAVIHGGAVEAREVTVWGHVQAGVLISHQAASVEAGAKSSDGMNSEVEAMSHVSLSSVGIYQNSLAMTINGIPGFDLSELESFDGENFSVENMSSEDFSGLGIGSLEMLGIDVFDSVSSRENESDLSTAVIEVTVAARLETASVERSLSQATVSEVEAVEAVE